MLAHGGSGRETVFEHNACLFKDDRIGGESVTLIFSFNYVEIK